MVRLIGTIVVAAAALCPLAASAEACGALPCRANGEPYVTDKNTIIIYPGESFAVQIDIARGKVGRAQPVTAEETGTITLDFKPQDAGMILIVHNHLADIVKYDATMKGPDGRLVYTSSCPVGAGMGSYEGWPHPIQYLELSNFRPLAPDADQRCE